MGIVIGIFCLSAFIWAGAGMALKAFGNPDPGSVVLGGLGCGYLLQMPLANISSGELGFIFWTFVAISSLNRQAP
jgi:hypothetical protein